MRSLNPKPQNWSPNPHCKIFDADTTPLMHAHSGKFTHFQSTLNATQKNSPHFAAQFPKLQQHSPKYHVSQGANTNCTNTLRTHWDKFTLPHNLWMNICSRFQFPMPTTWQVRNKSALGGPVYSIISSLAQFWRFSVAVFALACYIELLVGGLLVGNRSADLSVAIEESVNFCTLV